MPNLLALSFEGTLTPAFDLHCLEPSHVTPDGWGIACYPGGEPAAQVLKEAAPSSGSIKSALISAWERLESSIFIVHIRSATWGAITEANTQPLQRAWGRRDWIIAHSGSLEHRLPLSTRFEPVGSTDTEQVFCELLGRIADAGHRSLGDVPPETLLAWLHDLNRHGALTCALSDGQDLAIYADRRGNGEVFVLELLPPHGPLALFDDELTVDLTRRGIHSRKGIVVSSTKLALREGERALDWKRLAPGSLLLVRQGAVRAHLSASEPPSAPPLDSLAGPPPPVQVLAAQAFTPQSTPGPDIIAQPAHDFIPRKRPMMHAPARAEERRYQVLHKTVYRYANPVERSSHLLRLFPTHDRLQTVHRAEVTVSVPGHTRDFEDVFGNRVRRMMLETPYTELAIEARSEVSLHDVEPLDFRPARVRSTLPLVWMPWQRQVLQPFLLPPELAESELYELTEYAMSFAQRNDYELLDTLLDMNATIFTDFQYKQGATLLTTSPFDVYVNRRGVCQDFANLFICLARLIGVPARYVCGYLYTGPKAANARMGEASHAWVQVYLPEAGWKGFDPTNGVIAQTEHVRVAAGRNYSDATPTSGTIYVGGGGETLTVEVRVTRV